MSKSKKEPDLRLSYSSAQDIRMCERRWYNRKVLGKKPDKDYEEGDQFMIGKAFHYVLEMTGHKYPKKMVDCLKACSAHDDINLTREYYPLITAMVKRYCELHEKSQLNVVAVEEEIQEDKFFIGYIDAIMSDNDGNWWVVDLKTTGSFREDYLPPLIKNTQLSLYAPYAIQLSEKLGLDKEKFQGARYRTTVKPRLKRRNGESASSYARRLYDSCSSYDVILTSDLLDSDALNEHEIVRNRAEQLIKGYDIARRNYSNCTAFFKPCPYFSDCHGMTFTEAKDKITVLEAT